jgi:hypothetical protein
MLKNTESNAEGLDIDSLVIEHPGEHSTSDAPLLLMSLGLPATLR